MVSGFFTSPCDHSRIFSGEANEIRIAEKDSGSFGFSKKLKMSLIVSLPSSYSQTTETGLGFALILLPCHSAAGTRAGGAAEAACALALAATSRAISSSVDSCLRG